MRAHYTIRTSGASTVQASPGLVRVIPMVAHASTCVAAQLCATVYSLERREVSGGAAHFLFCGLPRGAAEQPSSDRRVMCQLQPADFDQGKDFCPSLYIARNLSCRDVAR